LITVWPAPRGVADRVVPLLLGLLLLGFTIRQLQHQVEIGEAATGCDRFGYVRQAALFRAHGLAGLDTRLETPNSRRLIEAMRASGDPVETWNQAVAPHCHHYKPAVDRVVLQYPPGTGLLMLAFPAPVQSRGLLFAATLGIAALFAGLAAAGRAVRPALVALLAGGLVVAAEQARHFSDSLAPALLLAVLAGALLEPAFTARRPWLPLLAGLLIGFSGVVRVPNLALAFGPLVLLGWAALARRRGAEWMRLGGFGAGLLAGLVPLLAGNLINTGSILGTTYDRIDASPPVLDLAAVWRGLRFYLEPQMPALLLVASLALGLCGLCRQRRPALLAGLLSMALSLAYLLPHAVLISYYLTPAAGFLAAAAVAPAALRKAGWRGAARAARAAAVVLIGGAIWAGRQHYYQDPVELAPAVRAALAADPIVWIDYNGGRFVLEQGAYAAKLRFASPERQDRLLAAAAAAGIPQLIALDTDAMKEIAARLGSGWRLAPLGQAYGFEVDRLEPAAR
jgi:hypothetical protein